MLKAVAQCKLGQILIRAGFQIAPRRLEPHSAHQNHWSAAERLLRQGIQLTEPQTGGSGQIIQTNRSGNPTENEA